MAHDDLLPLIERFLSETGMGPTYFGSEAVGNSKLVRRLREGRPITTDTDRKVRAYVAERIKIRRREARSFLKRSADLTEASA
jgi:hypothetical protein